MKQFISNLFRSSGSNSLDDQYKSGVLLLQKGDYSSAARTFWATAAAGHLSSIYNLALMYKQGLTESFEIEKAITLFKQAADLGHERAKLHLLQFQKLASEHGLGKNDLTNLIENFSKSGGDGAFVFGLANEIIRTTPDREELTDFVFMELDRASKGNPSARAFVQSTGISQSNFLGSLGRSVEGTTARMQSDLLDHIVAILMTKGFAESSIVFARCSIVGYVIKKCELAPMGALLPLAAYNTADGQDLLVKNQKREFVFTSPSEPKLELQSKEAAGEYISKLSKATRREDVYTELANVMAAKFNLMSMPIDPADFESKQRLITELTDKATWICVLVLGRETVIGHFGTDLRQFNELIMEIDNQVADQNLEPEKHGEMLLTHLRHFLQRSK